MESVTQAFKEAVGAVGAADLVYCKVSFAILTSLTSSNVLAVD